MGDYLPDFVQRIYKGRNFRRDIELPMEPSDRRDPRLDQQKPDLRSALIRAMKGAKTVKDLAQKKY